MLNKLTHTGTFWACRVGKTNAPPYLVKEHPERKNGEKIFGM